MFLVFLKIQTAPYQAECTMNFLYFSILHAFELILDKPKLHAKKDLIKEELNHGYSIHRISCVGVVFRLFTRAL